MIQKAEQMRMAGDYLLIRRLDSEKITKGGIVLPDSAAAPPKIGKVVRAGPGRFEDGKFKATESRVGEYVLFGQFAGQEITVGDNSEDYLIMKDSEVLAWIDE